MGGKPPFFSCRALLLLLAIALSSGITAAPARANELPLVNHSPLVGFAFDDPPLALPVQANFQMAMLTASSEIGRSCGKMEAYGWRLNKAEQQRVNRIFLATVDHLRSLNYDIETQVPDSVSHDITLFTADRPDKHFLFMWSAGDVGLVMTLCQSSAPLPQRGSINTWASEQKNPDSVVSAMLGVPPSAHQGSAASFSPVGSWVGYYVCGRNYFGATLQITNLNKDNVEGVFHFYPTPKAPHVPEGRYTVYGQYDGPSHRIVINPGKWLQRPDDIENTVMVGDFDPPRRTFSAYFQGIDGCTSFEANYKFGADITSSAKKPVKHKKKPKKPARKVVHVAPKGDAGVTPTAASAVEQTPPTGLTMPTSATTPTETPAPEVTAPPTSAAAAPPLQAPAPTPTSPSIPTSEPPAPAPTLAPANVPPEPLPPTTTPAANAMQAPTSAVPEATPSPSPAPAAAPSSEPAPAAPTPTTPTK